jgi:hypothetical protein
VEGLPGKVKVKLPSISANQDSAECELSAAADAVPGEHKCQVVAQIGSLRAEGTLEVTVAKAMASPPPGSKPSPERVPRLPPREALQKSITVDKAFNSVQLQTVLEYLSEKAGVSIVAETASFQSKGIAEIESQPIRLARQRDVTLDEVLRQVVSQIRGRYVVRRDVITIVAR